MFIFLFACVPHKKQVVSVSFSTVHGRQGIAAMDGEYYVSGSKSLYRYNDKWDLIAENKDPFRLYQVSSNHIGDIEAYEGELYIAAEWFEDGVGNNIQVAIHDAKTLSWKRSFPFYEASGQKEVSGITIDAERESVWLCSWVGGESGRHIYEYDLKTGDFRKKLRLSTEIEMIQGIEYYNNHLYITADDGAAEEGLSDHIYRVDLEGNVALYHTLTELNDVGEIEGLSIDEGNQRLLVHSNRGKRIILGMPKGFYPGYDREIHEVYSFPLPQD